MIIILYGIKPNLNMAEAGMNVFEAVPGKDKNALKNSIFLLDT